MGKLFLIPNTLGDSNIHGVLPSEVIARIKNIKIFASENPQNTRRFLKQIDKSIVLEEPDFFGIKRTFGSQSSRSLFALPGERGCRYYFRGRLSGNRRSRSRIGRFSPSESDSSCAAGRSIVDFVGFNRFGL